MLTAALGYSAAALSSPASPPLTQAQITTAENGIRMALTYERDALADVGKARKKLTVLHLTYSSRLLGDVLEDDLAGHDLGSYNPTSDLTQALKLDEAAHQETGSTDPKAHKRALTALAEAIRLKKKALALLENLSANGPTTETGTTPAEPLEACAFVGGPPTPTSGFPLVVKVFEPGQSGAVGGINVTGVGPGATPRTFVLDPTGAARVQFGAQPGTAVITISLTTLSHQSQTFGPFTFPVSTATAPASDCTPHQ